jgi:FkbM family methyltransferase
MTLKDKIKIALYEPHRIPKALTVRILWFFKLYILKDEYTVVVNRWNKEQSDGNLRLLYPLTTESIVFDLGGYKGDFASEVNARYGCYVYVFEPISKFYKGCVARFESNEKIKCFNYGLSNEDGSFFINDSHDSSSLIRANPSGNYEEVNIKSFSNELKELGIKQIDLLKINVEGSEFLILSDIIKNDLASQINYLQIQFHTFFPNSKFLRNEIRRKLSETHEEQWNYPFVWESWKRKN